MKMSYFNKTVKFKKFKVKLLCRKKVRNSSVENSKERAANVVPGSRQTHAEVNN